MARAGQARLVIIRASVGVARHLATAAQAPNTADQVTASQVLAMRTRAVFPPTVVAVPISQATKHAPVHNLVPAAALVAIAALRQITVDQAIATLARVWLVWRSVRMVFLGSRRMALILVPARSLVTVVAILDTAALALITAPRRTARLISQGHALREKTHE